MKKLFLMVLVASVEKDLEHQWSEMLFFNADLSSK